MAIDSVENSSWFYLICYYLNKCGYVLKEFPDLLKRPPVNSPSEFTYNAIRNLAFRQNKDLTSSVPYSYRRRIVADFHFEKENNGVVLDEDLNSKFIMISTRNATFENMTLDEKLAEISNLIEHL